MNLKLFGLVVVEIFNYQGGQLGIAGPRPRLDRAPVPRVNSLQLRILTRQCYRYHLEYTDTGDTPQSPFKPRLYRLRMPSVWRGYTPYISGCRFLKRTS